MLTGADGPEIFCVAIIQKRSKGTPDVIEKPLGRSSLDPLMTLFSRVNFYVNFLNCKDDELLQATKRLWSSDFEKGTTILNLPN